MIDSDLYPCRKDKSFIDAITNTSKTAAITHCFVPVEVEAVSTAAAGEGDNDGTRPLKPSLDNYIIIAVTSRYTPRSCVSPKRIPNWRRRANTYNIIQTRYCRGISFATRHRATDQEIRWRNDVVCILPRTNVHAHAHATWLCIQGDFLDAARPVLDSEWNGKTCVFSEPFIIIIIFLSRTFSGK